MQISLPVTTESVLYKFVKSKSKNFQFYNILTDRTCSCYKLNNYSSVHFILKSGLEIQDPCVPNPCRNEGVCKTELNTFECRCVPGF